MEESSHTNYKVGVKRLLGKEEKTRKLVSWKHRGTGQKIHLRNENCRKKWKRRLNELRVGEKRLENEAKRVNSSFSSIIRN